VQNKEWIAKALDIAWVALKDKEGLSEEDIRTYIDISYPTFSVLLGNNDSEPENKIKEHLIRYLQSRLITWVPGDITGVEFNENHVPWLEDKKSEISWDFWNRYQKYLSSEKGWNGNIIGNLDLVTDEILGKLENPEREGQWDRRGMVVGDVQSGKTASYIGLINKAIDSGYQLIVILAGMQNSLRSQTQMRLNEGVLGFDIPSDKSIIDQRFAHKTGVGKLLEFKKHLVIPLTSSDEKGDFRLAFAKQAAVYPGHCPIVLVVKKNVSVLKNLRRWIESTPWGKETDQGKYLENVPFLLIDDEADNASVNTRKIYDESGNIDPDADITRINGLIREILTKFAKSAYVGYTATPFANIFIDPESESDTFGQDLFPRSFIIGLPSPSNYIGAEKIFGLDEAPDINIESKDSLPLVRYVTDYYDDIPDRHNKDWIVPELPLSLKIAIRSFILATAGRASRGQQKVHNSMLVHVTRYVKVQGSLSKLITDELQNIQHRLRYGEGNNETDIREEFRQLWNEEFLPVSQEIIDSEEFDDPLIDCNTWNEIEEHLLKSAMKTTVLTANGYSKEALEYRNHEENGLCVIVVGGDKLSRGLTLEGLTISYYLRTSRMYDTLMQMGRWFGFRPGYLDLCRIFTTPELADWYSHIALANREFRNELIYMSDRGMTPQEYGLRVRTHPDGLIVTSMNKMRSGDTVRISYAEAISESVVYHADKKIIQKNNDVYGKFIEELGWASKNIGNKEYYRWNNISGEKIADLFSNIETHEDSLKADSKLLEMYIRSRISDRELITWTVILLSGGNGNEREIGGHTVHCVIRGRLNKGDSFAGKYTIKRLLSPRDEWLDLDEKTQKLIMSETLTEYMRDKANNKTKRKNKPENPSGRILRAKRANSNGLLLLYPLDINEEINGEETTVLQTIGFGVSFPPSDFSSAVEYRVNKIYYNTEIED